jgi:hypothetical protein
MFKRIINRTLRTAGDIVFHFAPVWHLTNLRREAYDQLEDLHYQVGYCRAGRNEILDRLEEIGAALAFPNLDPQEKSLLESERRQLEARLKEAEDLEAKAAEVVEAYKESLPRVVNQLDMAIQITRMNKGQRSVLKMLGNSQGNDGSDVAHHVKKSRSEAYALSEQLSGHLAANRLRQRKLLARK